MSNNTITYFKEISKIPRESGNEKLIADYIINFAKKNNLPYETDKYHNVIIKKYQDQQKPIILQAHLDMVCVKDPTKKFNFKTDPIEVYEEDGYLTARGTTLGADNGIGVAQILNILTSPLPVSIEAVFTTSEETTMDGAINIDLKNLKGDTMLNLDGFSSDSILIESASFTDIDLKLNYEFNAKENNFYEISLSGLDGGHSGFDINKEKGNSIHLLTELLLQLNGIKIADFKGGTKINVIPSTAKAIIASSDNIDNITKNFLKKYQNKYPHLKLTIKKINKEKKVLNTKETNHFLKALKNLHHGTFYTNKRNEVTTSQNLAIINLKHNLIQIGLRSSIESERKEALNYLKSYSQTYNYELVTKGYQPGFKTEEDTSLVTNLVKAYEEINGCKPKINSIHVAVEVGLLKEKKPNLEAVIISPNIIGAHTTSEKVEIASIEKCDAWLFQYLSNLK